MAICCGCSIRGKRQRHFQICTKFTADSGPYTALMCVINNHFNKAKNRQIMGFIKFVKVLVLTINRLGLQIFIKKFFYSFNSFRFIRTFSKGHNFIFFFYAQPHQGKQFLHIGRFSAFCNRYIGFKKFCLFDKKAGRPCVDSVFIFNFIFNFFLIHFSLYNLKLFINLISVVFFLILVAAQRKMLDSMCNATAVILESNKVCSFFDNRVRIFDSNANTCPIQQFHAVKIITDSHYFI